MLKILAFTNNDMYNVSMDNKDRENYLYSSDYETLNDFCNELHTAFKELFICDVKRDKNDFVLKFRNGGNFKVSVSELTKD